METLVRVFEVGKDATVELLPARILDAPTRANAMALARHMFKAEGRALRALNHMPNNVIIAYVYPAKAKPPWTAAQRVAHRNERLAVDARRRLRIK